MALTEKTYAIEDRTNSVHLNHGMSILLNADQVFDSLRTMSIPFFPFGISISIASFGLNPYWESMTMLEGITMYWVFAFGFFKILLSTLSTKLLSR